MSANNLTSLVRRAQRGERQAHGQLAERFGPAVYAIALRRLRDHTEAQDLTQEVFVHSLVRLGQVRDPRCVGGWLRQMARRMAINRQMRRRHLQGLPGGPAVPAPESGPLESVLRAERVAAVHRGLRALPLLDRQTLEAFYLRGRSLRQMVAEFRVPAGTIKRRLHTARGRLRRALERNGFSA